MLKIYTLYQEKMWFEVPNILLFLSGAMLVLVGSDTWFGGMVVPNEKKFVITDRLKTFSTVTVAGMLLVYGTTLRNEWC